MAYRNLDEYLIRLEQSEHLHQIDTSTSRADLQLVAHQYEGQALLFTDVVGVRFPVVVNAFSDGQRLAWALGNESLDALGERLSTLIDPSVPRSLSALMGRAADLMTAVRSAGVTMHRQDREAAYSPVDPDLYELGGLPLDERQVGFQAAQLIVGLGDSMRMCRTDAVILSAQRLRVEPFDPLTFPTPAALVLGGDPAQVWSSLLKLPRYINSYYLAGWLRGRAVPLVTAQSQPVEVPANADVIIEGLLHPDSHGMAVMEVTRISHSAMPYFMFESQQAHCWSMRAVEHLLLPVLRLLHPEVRALHFGDKAIIVSAEITHEMQAQQIMYTLWGLEMTADRVLMVVLPASVNPHDADAVGSALRSQGLTVVQTRTVSQRGSVRRIGISAIGDQAHASALILPELAAGVLLSTLLERADALRVVENDGRLILDLHSAATTFTSTEMTPLTAWKG